MDTAEDSNDVEHGPVVHATRMVTAPTIQTVATTTPSAVLWVLAQLVLYGAQQRLALTLHDYMDLLRRIKWKMYQQKNRVECVGNYLSIIDPTA